MRTEQILTALKIAETGSIRKAVRELYLTEPGGLFQLNQLEKELGFPLFIRSNSKGFSMVTTAQGEKWLALAARMLEMLDTGTAMIKREGEVRVREKRFRSRKGDGL